MITFFQPPMFTDQFFDQQIKLVDTELAYVDAQADATRSWAEVERAIGGNLP